MPDPTPPVPPVAPGAAADSVPQPSAPSPDANTSAQEVSTDLKAPPAGASTNVTAPAPTLGDLGKAAIGSVVHGIKDEAHRLVSDPLGEVAATAKDVGAGLAKGGTFLSDLPFKVAGGITQAVTGGKEGHDWGDKFNPLHVSSEESDQAYGAAQNGVHQIARSVTEFGAESLLTPGFGAAKLGRVAKAAASVARVSAIQTIADDPRARDAITTLAPAIPGRLGQALTSTLAANPHDPIALAYAKSFGRNMVSNTLFEGILHSATAVMTGVYKLAAEKTAQAMADTELPPDVAKVTPHPDGSATVEHVPQNVSTDVNPSGWGNVEAGLQGGRPPHPLSEQQVADLKARAAASAVEYPEGAKVKMYRGVAHGQDPLKPGHAGVTFATPDAEYASQYANKSGEVHQVEFPAPKKVMDVGRWEDADLQARREWEALPPDQRGSFDQPKYKSWDDRIAEARAGGFDAIKAIIGGREEWVFLSQEGARVIPPETFPDRVTAEVEAGARNEVRDQMEHVPDEGLPPELTSNNKAGLVKIRDAMAAGAPAHVIQDVVRAHGIVMPYQFDEGHLTNYLSQMADVLRMPPESVRNDASLAREALDHLAPGEDPQSTFQRVSEWFGGTDKLDAKIVATRLYMQTLGDQTAKLGEAFDTGPKSPMAKENLQQAFTRLLEVYVPFRRNGTEIARALRAMNPEVGGTEAAAMGGEQVQKDAIASAEPPKEFSPEAAQASPAAAKLREALRAEKPPTEAQALNGLTAPERIAATGQLEPLNDRELSQFARSVRIANGDPTEVLEAVREAMMDRDPRAGAEARAAKMSTGEKVLNTALTYKVNNMISGVPTAVVTATGSTIMTAKLPAEMMVGGVGKMLKSAALLDRPGVGAGADLVHKGWDVGVGDLLNIGEALKAGARAFRAGDSQIDPLHMMFPGGQVSPELVNLGKFGFLHTIFTLPTRMHMTIAEMSKTLNYRSFVRAQSLEDSRRLGLSPARASQSLADDLKAAFDPNGKAIQNSDALYEARRATFTLPLQQGTIGRSMQEALNKHPIMRAILAPFQKVQTNIFRENWAMLPGLGAFQSQVKQDIAAGGEKAARAMGNMAIGGAAVSYFLAKAASGELIGRGPSDPELRDQMRKNDETPYSITIGGHKISLQRVDPFGSIGQIVPDMRDAIGHIKDRYEQQKAWREDSGLPQGIDMRAHPVLHHLRLISDLWDATRGSDSEDGMRAITAVAGSISNAVLSKTYAKSLSELVEAVNAPPGSGAGERWIADQAKTMIPGSKFWEGMNGDTTRREARGIVEQVLRGVPGWSKDLEPERNLFGEKHIIPPGFLNWANGHVNPFIVSNPSGQDAVQHELIELGKGMPKPPKMTKGAAGLGDIDWTDRKLWDHEPDATGQLQSPYDRMMELLGTPDGSGKTAKDYVTDLVKSPEYKALPQANPGDQDSERYVAVAKLYSKLLAGAKGRMMGEPRYKDFAASVLGMKVARTLGHRFGADSVAQSAVRSIRQAAISPQSITQPLASPTAP